MSSFKAPNFYMPYVARTNPNVPGARVHCKEWARAVGILRADGDVGGESVWDERAFDAMNFALFAGQTHPDVPPNELDLLADWYVWGWYMDDLYDTRSKDLAAARDYLARLVVFMPEDPAVPVPGSANAMERALADLWPRTAPSMSPSWRRRYVETITAFADEMLREIFVVSAVGKRILDPIEYVTTRRATSGLQWSAALVEHSLRAEVPEILLSTRPLEVLNDCFIDSVALRNDIVSYDNDVRDGKVNNAVTVVRAFVDGTIQEAADVINDIVTSRLVQFETTVAVELEPVFSEYWVDPAGRSDVWRYLRGLQDWMAGIRKWESRPGGRYAPAASSGSLASRCVACSQEPGAPAVSDIPNVVPGLQRWRGHSHQPFKRLGTLAMPEFVMPYPVRVNVHLDQARRQTADWFAQVGIFEPCAGISGIVWDRETFDVYDLPACVARVAPDASLPELDLASLWYSWGTWADDCYLLFQHRGDSAGAAMQSRRISLFMPLDDAAAPAPANVLERSLLDLWARTARVLPRAALRQLRSSTKTMFGAWAWEVGNHVLHRIPDPIDYLTMRPRTLGAGIMLDLLHLGLRDAVPEQVVGSLAMRSLDFAAVTYCGLMNDICSFVREIEFDGELHNGVLVAQKLLRVDVDDAVLLVNDLLTARIRQFDQVVDVELPALADEHGLDASQRAALDAYVERLRGWMSGMLDWHRSSGRHEQSRVRAFRAQRRESTGGGWLSNPGHAHQQVPVLPKLFPAAR